MSVETRVSSHYTHGDLLNAIDAALAKAGKNPATLRLEDLAPVDEFHIRGSDATAELGAHLGLRPEHAVLDVGSGLGGASRQLASAYKCKITGIDLTDEYCQVATALASRVGLSDRVQYRQGSALAMPFTGGSFDIAYTQHVAMNISDKATLYREIARVLKPHGKFGIYDLLQGEGGVVLFPVPWAQDASTSFLATPDEMRMLLSEANFENHRLERHQRDWQGVVQDRERAARRKRAVATRLPSVARCRFQRDGEESGPQSNRGSDSANRDHLCEAAVVRSPIAHNIAR